MEKLKLQLQSTLGMINEECEKTKKLVNEIYTQHEETLENVIEEIEDYPSVQLCQLYKFVSETYSKLHTLNIDLEFDILPRDFPECEKHRRNISSRSTSYSEDLRNKNNAVEVTKATVESTKIHTPSKSKIETESSPPTLKLEGTISQICDDEKISENSDIKSEISQCEVPSITKEDVCEISKEEVMVTSQEDDNRNEVMSEGGTEITENFADDTIDLIDFSTTSSDVEELNYSLSDTLQISESKNTKKKNNNKQSMSKRKVETHESTKPDLYIPPHLRRKSQTSTMNTYSEIMKQSDHKKALLNKDDFPALGSKPKKPIQNSKLNLIEPLDHLNINRSSTIEDLRNPEKKIPLVSDFDDSRWSVEEDSFENVSDYSGKIKKAAKILGSTTHKGYQLPLQPKLQKPDISLRPSKKNPFGEISSRSSSSSSRTITPNMEWNGSMESTNGIVIKNRKFPPLNTYCYVSYVVSPREFYIQVEDGELDHLEDMMMKIGEVYSNTDPHFQTKIDARRRIGQFCIVNISLFGFDWYRCKVINWLPEDENENVQIQLIDYGDKEIVHIRNLRLIQQEFSNYSKFSIQCHLAYLHPPGSSDPNASEHWPTKSINQFKIVVSEAYLIISHCFKEGNSFAIELERSDWETLSIGQYMIDNNYATEILIFPENTIKNKFIIKQIEQAQGLAGITENMTDVEALAKYLDNTKTTEAGDINEAIANYNPGDEARTCKFIRQGVSCYKGTACQFDHTPLRADGLTNDTISVYVSAFNELVLPNKEEQVILKITAMRTVKTFFGQIVHEEAMSDFEKLVENMNRPATIRAYERFTFDPALGQIVIAKWDDRWLRAKVLDTYENMHSPELWLTVSFVDYGQEHNVPISDVRKIPDVFLDLPFQAILFFLHNIILNTEASEANSREYFEDRFLWQTLDATVKEVSSTGCVEVQVFNQNNFDISVELIEKGYAIPYPSSDINPIDSEKFLVD